MSIQQILRIIWARKWLVLALMTLVSIVGAAVTVTLPKQFTAETAMVVEMRIDPALGALAMRNGDDVPGWDIGSGTHLSAIMPSTIADLAAYHHDAVQPAING